MGYLIAVAFAPLLAPVLYRVLHDRPSAMETFDKFVYLAVPILVGWQVLPHAWEEQNALLILALTCGVILPIVIERGFQSVADETDNLAIAAGLSGLALHAFWKAPRSSRDHPPRHPLSSRNYPTSNPNEFGHLVANLPALRYEKGSDRNRILGACDTRRVQPRIRIPQRSRRGWRCSLPSIRQWLTYTRRLPPRKTRPRPLYR